MSNCLPGTHLSCYVLIGKVCLKYLTFLSALVKMNAIDCEKNKQRDLKAVILNPLEKKSLHLHQLNIPDFRLNQQISKYSWTERELDLKTYRLL